jgi:hypothetical protein
LTTKLERKSDKSIDVGNVIWKQETTKST